MAPELLMAVHLFCAHIHRPDTEKQEVPERARHICESAILDCFIDKEVVDKTTCFNPGPKKAKK